MSSSTYDPAATTRRERRSHEAFASSRRLVYVAQPGLLEALDRFVAEGGPDGQRIVVVSGPSGAGKSALLANWAARHRATHPGAFVIEHYVDAAPAGSNHFDVIGRIVGEIAEHHDAFDQIPSTPDSLEEQFPAWLARIAGERPVIVIDGVDQLQSGSREVPWMPEFLPNGVRVVVSATDVAELRGGLAADYVLSIPPLASEQRGEIARLLIGRSSGDSLREHATRFATDHRTSSPLFLRLGIEELARAPAEADRVSQFLDAENVDVLVETIVERVEADHSAEVVSAVLTWIDASRYGLSESDLAELSGSDSIAAILHALRNHLIVLDTRYRFIHEYMRRVVRRRYAMRSRTEVHRELAVFIRGHGDVDRRAAEELWHLAQAGLWDLLEKALTDRTLFRRLWRGDRQADLFGYLRMLEGRCVPSDLFARAFEGWRGDADDLEDDAERLGELFMAVGDFDAARRWYESIANSSDLGRRLRSSRGLGSIEYFLGHADAADAILRSSLRLAAEAGGVNDSVRSELMIDLGAVLCRKGENEEAIGLFENALELAGRTDDRWRQAACRNNLASALTAVGQLDNALSQLRAAWNVSRQQLGGDHPETARILGNIGIVERMCGNAEAAEAASRSALASFELMLGNQHRSTINARQNLATLMRELGRLDEAEQLQERVVAELRAFDTIPSAELATALASLASIRKLGPAPERAEECYLECLAIRTELFGVDCDATRRTRENLERYRAFMAADAVMRDRLRREDFRASSRVNR